MTSREGIRMITPSGTVFTVWDSIAAGPGELNDYYALLGVKPLSRDQDCSLRRLYLHPGVFTLGDDLRRFFEVSEEGVAAWTFELTIAGNVYLSGPVAMLPCSHVTDGHSQDLKIIVRAGETVKIEARGQPIELVGRFHVYFALEVTLGPPAGP